ncbi:MAG: hypothetical protein NC253_03230 [Ruminococcus sp.]|nr:hypothetical protein [Ruminococcus sp.]MCM1480148.1 hypothetical protein [Muribaculaceae bacterium]
MKNIDVIEKCPYCGNLIETSCPVKVLDWRGYEKKDMAYDTQMEIESEPLLCNHCNKEVILRGTVGEYPTGTIEFADVKFEKV